MNPALRERTYPTQCGVYLFKDARGKVLYVGKAINLRNRLRSYFSGNDSRPRIRFLMARLHEIGFVIAASEKEALLLENTLIKEHRPPYNMFFRDDKDYLWLKLDRRHPFPRLLFVRRPKAGGAKLFGPYASAAAVRETVRFVTTLFPLRTCSDHEFRNRTRPCLEHQVKRCPAPCVGFISGKEYGDLVGQAVLFLEGKSRDILTDLEARMATLAEEERFEEAALLRDRIRAIEKTIEPQAVIRADEADRDVLGFAREADRVALVVMDIRGGKLKASHVFHHVEVFEEDAEILETFVLQYYERHPIPPEVLAPPDVPGGAGLDVWLTARAGRPVNLRFPKRGELAALLDRARLNARTALDSALSREERDRALVEALGRELGSPGPPAVMECLDISNISGTAAVGSVVVFRDGRPSKKDYRRFRIRLGATQGTAVIDDYAMMRELVRRRYGRLKSEEKPLPDLILIDGGQGHLEAARGVLEELGLSGRVLAALAKDREHARPARVDKVHLPGRPEPLVLSAAHLLMRLRDEAHRFAITYHRLVRSRSAIRSALDDIRGIGPKTRRRLLVAFGSAKGVEAANVPLLVAKGKVSASLANRIYRHFHPGVGASPAKSAPQGTE